MWRAALLLAALAVAGPVAAEQPAPPPVLPPDPGGSWQVVELEGLPVGPADEVSLVLEKGRVGGSNGCNRLTGSYSLMPGFSFGPLGSTRMACHGRRGELEAAFTAAVAQVNDWRLAEDGSLELLHDARPVLRAVPLP